MRTILKLFAISVGLILSGCATIVNDDHEFMPVLSAPKGATVEATGTGQTCVTPCRLRLRRGTSYTIRVSKEGYESKQFLIDGSSWDAMLWGNILLSPLLGVGLDFITNKAYDFEPEVVKAELRAK